MNTFTCMLRIINVVFYVLFHYIEFKVIPKQLPGQFQTQIVFQLQFPSFGSTLLVNSLTYVTSLLPNIHPYVPMVSYCIGNTTELY